MNTELIHNKTYAHRLPPTYVEQARGLANFRENLVFSDPAMGGIGNIASRTALSSILEALQRIAFNGDPLQLMLISTTYQPFISLFHQTDMIKSHPELGAIPDFGSVLAIELRRAHPPDARDFLRFKFRNGSQDEDFETLHVFGHNEDIPVTEFIYRLENSVVNSNREWAKACGTTSSHWFGIEDAAKTNSMAGAAVGLALAFLVVLGVWLASTTVSRIRRRQYVQLPSEDEVPFQRAQVAEKARLHAY